GYMDGGRATHQTAQSLDHCLPHPLKKTKGSCRGEPASVFKPQRVGKMVEGHKRPDAAPAKRLKHGAVAAERSQVPTALFGFDPAPLKREPQRVDAKPLRAVKVLLRVAPPVASQAGVVARLDAASLLPGRPSIIKVAAFHLVGRRSHSPDEAGREDVNGFFAGSVIHRLIGS